MKLTSKIILCIFIITLIAIFSPSSQALSPTSSNIPKHIWTYWNTDDIPLFIKDCIATWKYHNPSWNVTILTNSTLKQHLTTDILNYKHADSPARISDFIRLQILEKYGGVWMDSSMICSSSLDTILNHDASFIGYYISGFTTDPKYPIIESWFLAAPPKSPLIRDWNKEFLRMNTFETVHAYINNLRYQNINLQKIDAPEYLAIHCACQKVIQTKDYSYYVTSAELGPYKYKKDNDWVSQTSIERLCQYPDLYMTPLVKFTAWERNLLIDNPILADCIIRNAKSQKQKLI